MEPSSSSNSRSSVVRDSSNSFVNTRLLMCDPPPLMSPFNVPPIEPGANTVYFLVSTVKFYNLITCPFSFKFVFYLFRLNIIGP